MTSKLEQYAATGPHLELVKSVPIEAGGTFVVHRDHVFISARYGSSHALTIVDITEPANAGVARTMHFKGAIAAVALHGDVLLAAESNRALNFLNIEDPANPDYFDCGLALGMSLYDVATLGDHAVLALNWDGVGLMDLRDPANARLTQRMKLDEGFVERLVVSGNFIFAAGASGGLRVFEVANGELAERGRITEPDFNASKVFDMGGTVWAIGSGKGDGEILVIDPAHPDEIQQRFPLECSWPKTLLPLKGGGAVGFYDHYTCLGYDPAAEWAGELFKQYTRDDDDGYFEIPCDLTGHTDEAQQRYWEDSLTCMDGVDDAAVVGDYLFTVQSQQFNVYRLTTDSVFHGVDGVRR